jgi:DNA-binding FadR family transcriptional regulator
MNQTVIQKKNYSQQVFNYIFGQIDTGKLKSGDKLPNERELSENLGISRPSLREALKALSSIGLLSTRHGGGTYVNEFGTEYLDSMLRFLTVIDTDFIVDFVQMRKIIESESSRLAAYNATDEQLLKLTKIHERRSELYDNHLEDLEPYKIELQNLDLEFHTLIVIASNNVVFQSFLRAMHNIIKKHQVAVSAETSMISHSIFFHGKVLEAIKNKSGSEAAKAMYDHVEDIERNLN